MLRRLALTALLLLSLLALNLPAAPLRAAPAPAPPAPPTPLLPPDRQGQPALQGALPSANQTSEFMYGTVHVDLLLVESQGKQENWSARTRNQVISSVRNGLDWWVAASRAQGRPGAQLRFDLDTRTVTTTYEPITLNSAFSNGGSDANLWLADVVRGLGYSPASGVFPALRRFADDRRRAAGDDWGYSIIVVNSERDPDGTFADGYFAYSYVNGPYTVMTYDNGGWGIERMNHIVAHESGHIFGALDEYTGQCSNDATGGYLVIRNSNCAAGGNSEDSIMGDGDMILRAYQSYALSKPVQSMIGWRDSDGDGLYDVVDTISNSLTPLAGGATWQPTLSYSATNVATDSPWRFDGQATWSSGGIARTPISINHVAGVEYRVDGGGWSTASPLDAPWGSDREPYSMTVALGSRGNLHRIETRALNRWGQPAALASDEVLLRADADPPTSTLTLSASEAMTLSIPLRWSGDDGGGIGLASYAIQVRAGDAAWADWITGTTSTSATYQAAAPGRYCFRSLASDLLGNRQQPDAAGTCVTIRLPQPNLRLAAPSFAPDTPLAQAGKPLQFVVAVQNDGTQNAAASTLGVELRRADGSLAATKTITVEALAAGASLSLTIDLEPLNPGQYKLQLRIDPDDSLPESDEGDNSSELAFNVEASQAPANRLIRLPLLLY